MGKSSWANITRFLIHKSLFLRGIKMKICMITPEYPPSFCSGVGIHVHNLVEKLVSMGLIIEVITRGKKYNRCIMKNGLTIVRIPYMPLYPFHLYIHGLFLNKYLKENEHRFDLIHIHNANVPEIFSQIPKVITVHGTMQGYIQNRPIQDIQSLVIKIFSSLFIKIDKMNINRANKVIAVSKATALDIKDYYGVDGAEVIYNGVNTDYFSPDGNIPKEKMLLNVGRLSSEKGLFDLIDAFKIVNNKYPEIKLYIAGSGPLLNKLRNKTKEYNLLDRIRFLGYISDKDCIKNLYRITDIYVLSSYVEGLPTTLLEAMSCGMPSVATSVKGSNEIIRNNIDGLLVPPNNPSKLAEGILNILSDEKLKNKFKLSSRKRIEENFDWNIISKKVKMLYDHILAPRNGP
jgi:glycosyltransferase involved in cell wall biosynthesis